MAKRDRMVVVGGKTGARARHYVFGGADGYPQGEMLFHPGDVKKCEDVSVLRLLGDGMMIAVVADAVSGAYNSEHPQLVVNGMTGGQLVAKAIVDKVRDCFGDLESLCQVMRYANERVERFVNAPHGVLGDAAFAAGATFAAMMITPRFVEILTAGDCIAAWQGRDGKVRSSRNQIRLHDEVLDRLHATHMQAVLLEDQAAHTLVLDDLPKKVQHAARERMLTLDDLPITYINKHIRPRMWLRSFEPMCEARRQDANKPGGYAFLNGSLEIENLWEYHRIPRGGVTQVVLVSDGMFPHDLYTSRDPKAIGNFLVTAFTAGGLKGIRKHVAAYQREHAKGGHVSFPEGTAIATTL